ncbi:sensor histidine kinase [Neptunomonas marina]|uniref:histidine kinase n=1 Tax=Neptunomonas marina TaxID=1815562 RepID=A0A437QCS7_9GAMM|nr:ATP-binding protein [Neptunomonas marina]RVU32326.1 sensor histidine kinase [Neptunomonas marina]
MNRSRLATGIVRLTAISTLLLGSLLAVLVAYRVGSFMEASEQQRIEKEIALIVARFDRFIDDRVTILRDHAEFSVLAHGVIQPDSMAGYVSDFMYGFQVLGRQYKETLVDPLGKTISTTQEHPSIHYKGADWLTTFIAGSQPTAKQPAHISLNAVAGNLYWRIALPVFSLDKPAGALITEIPFDELRQSKEWAAVWDGIALDILKNNVAVAQLGSRVTGDLIRVPWPKAGLEFSFVVDDRVVREEGAALITSLVVLIVLMSLIITGIAFFWSKKQLAEPISELSQGVKLLWSGKISRLKENHSWYETAQMARSINEMYDTLLKREKELKHSHDRLVEANDELQRSQKYLVQSEKMAGLGTMAAGVAHEINNPIGFVKSNLGSLQNYAGSLEAYVRDVDSAVAHSNEIAALKDQLNALKEQHDIDFLIEDIEPLLSESMEGIQRVSGIVAGLKDFARVDSGAFEAADINEGVRSTLKVVWNELKYHCTVHESYDQLPQVICNIGQLNQVFMNLIVNASQAIQGSGDIFISTQSEDSCVVIKVRDTGSGMDERTKKSLFNPFFTTKPAGKGTGLGLSISHGIVEKHGGVISVESQVGEGTTFTVRLPLKPPHVDVTEEQQHAEETTAG